MQKGFCFFCFFLLCHILDIHSYEPTPYVSETLWNSVQPYLLPKKHPAKPALDKIFRHARAVASLEAMKKAGFNFKQPRTINRLVAAKHSKLKGYIVKAYMDSQTMISNEGALWIQRIQGAQIIRESIQRNGYSHIMKVPKKWIYPLPEYPSPPEGNFCRRHFILVAQDMKIVSSKKNSNDYRTKMTKKKLDALRVILTENVLIDSTYIDNIPFCKDGKIAFVDTEHYHTSIKPLNLQRLASYLSPNMKFYWLGIIQ